MSKALPRSFPQVAILSIGTRLSESLRAAFIMKDAGDIGVTVADARYMKPLDTDLMSVAYPHPKLPPQNARMVSSGTVTVTLYPTVDTLSYVHTFAHAGDWKIEAGIHRVSHVKQGRR